MNIIANCRHYFFDSLFQEILLATSSYSVEFFFVQLTFRDINCYSTHTCMASAVNVTSLSVCYLEEWLMLMDCLQPNMVKVTYHDSRDNNAYPCIDKTLRPLDNCYWSNSGHVPSPFFARNNVFGTNVSQLCIDLIQLC
jgi:hypothetical protein